MGKWFQLTYTNKPKKIFRNDKYSYTAGRWTRDVYELNENTNTYILRGKQGNLGGPVTPPSVKENQTININNLRSVIDEIENLIKKINSLKSASPVFEGYPSKVVGVYAGKTKKGVKIYFMYTESPNILDNYLVWKRTIEPRVRGDDVVIDQHHKGFPSKEAAKKEAQRLANDWVNKMVTKRMT